MIRTFACLVSASLVPLSESGLFTPHPNGCQSGQEYGCAAQLEAVNRLETGQPRNTVAGVTTGKLDCSELYSHEGTWEVDLSATETVTATKNVFVKGHGGFVTWCGDIVGEPGSDLCITWKPGFCGAQYFHMSATRGVVGPAQREFETQPGQAVRRRLDDGTEVVEDDDLAVIEVYREYLDEDQTEGERRRLLEESLDAPELEYLPDGRKVSDVEYSIQQVQNWKDGRTQADMFLRSGGRYLRNTAIPVEGGSNRQLQTTTTLDDGSNIDIMVVYTAKAATLAGGEAALRAACATRYAQFATLMKNSNVTMSFTLVGLYQTSFVETTSLSNDLTTLRAGLYLTTGESIASVRASIGADVVQMLTNTPASCGYGYLFGPSSTAAWGVSNGFSAVHYGCMTQYSHMHEIGHNTGMTHDVKNAVSAFGYGYGYQICVTGGYRTLMAYSCSSGTTVARQPVLSSPNVTFMSRLSGTATADNKRVLSVTALRIANFYLSAKTAADSEGTPEAESGTEEVKIAHATESTAAVSMYSGKASTMEILYKGCYNDNGNKPDLNGAFVTMEGMTPLLCASYCSLHDFKVAGVQQGNECSCSNSYGSHGKATYSDCATPCTGDAEQMCGGTRRNGVYYITGSAEGFTYLGCYQDESTSPAFGSVPKVFKSGNSPAVCAEECEDFSYFGLQAGVKCFCSNLEVEAGAVATGCNVQCSGDDSKMCGGMGVNAVYSQRHSGAFTYKGCFEDKASKRDLNGARNYFAALNSPQTCYSYCKDAGFDHFALQNGYHCYCDNSFGTYGKAAAGACSVACSGDDTIPCGGAAANSVYGINF